MVAIPLVAASPDVIIPGDPAEYRRRVEAILSGGLPYVSVPFEHLPVMLVPMFLAWFLGGSASQAAYIIVFVLLMTVTLAMAAPLVERIGRRLGVPSAGWKWLAVVIPSASLMVFRNDPFVVLLFVVALYLHISQQRGSAAFAIAGSFAKVWPAALAAFTWPKEKVLSLWLAASGGIAVLLTWLPGFTAARRAVGIHAETMVGALIGGYRVGTGSDLGLKVTTAVYLETGIGAVAVNALIGLFVIALGMRAVLVASERREALLGLGTIVAGIILASQLLSLQYMLWLTPFIALSGRRRTVLVGVALSVLTGVLAWVWREVHFQEMWFYSLLTVRNLMILAIAVWLSHEARPATTT